MKVIERQVDNFNIVEDSYRPTDKVLKKYEHLLNWEILKHLANQNIEMVSIAPKDNITNFDESIVLVYKEAPSIVIQQYFNILKEKIDFQDYFALKCSKSKLYIKIYDREFYKYEIPQLPKNSRLAQQFGIGKYFGDAKLENHRDVYFFHTTPQTVYEHFKLGESTSELYKPTEHLALYGLTYLQDKNTSILKLKRYFYNNDFHIYKPQLI